MVLPGSENSLMIGRAVLTQYQRVTDGQTDVHRRMSSLAITWLGGLLVERRTSVSQIRGSIPGQVAAV